MMQPLKVHVSASNHTVRRAVLDKLADGGLADAVTTEPVQGIAVLAAGNTIENAIEACPAGLRDGSFRLLVAAERISSNGVLNAVRAGVHTLINVSDASSEQLVEAVRSTVQGQGRLPYGALVRLLSGSDLSVTGPEVGIPNLSPLTARQLSVLKLVADGHGNSAIARALSCSEHTVKNAIYELMGRLQARNRAHAVAHAVRAGLI
jgi:DNA-binding NarL/FixJ family response regulator